MSETRLSNREIIRKIEEWQKAGYVHPLTCGRDSSHPILKPKLRLKDNAVVLVCPKCGYIQKHIPRAVLKGVPTMPVFGFSEKSLKNVVRDIEELGKEGRKMAKKVVTVTISKSAWQALLRGESLAILRIFSEGELHHEFGDNPEKYTIRVKITPVSS